MGAFQKAERRKAKLKMAICGPSGSGKTYSAIKIAKGMGGKVALIDTENGSGQLYCDLAEYDVAEIGSPFTVDKYIGAIHEAEQAGYNVLIIDSLSHAWSKEGGILDEVDKRSGKNAFTSGWREATPMHNKLIDAILQSPLHIIVTMRAKTAYEIEKDEKGKVVPVKKGMAPEQRAGLEYEFTVVLDMDNTRHTATSGKDRTRLFDGQCFIPDENTGVILMQWLGTGIETQPQYYQPAPDYQGWQGAYQPMGGNGTPYQANVQQAASQQQYAQQQPQEQYTQPVPQAPIYGFAAYEQEITASMTAVWGNLVGFDIAGYIQKRPDFGGKAPAQLTTDECYKLMMEFQSYAQQKQGV